MRKWFKNVTTIEELRKKYRELLKMYHPDNEKGSVKVTQEINEEYDLVFSILNQETELEQQIYTCKENAELKAILNAIIGLNMTIEVIGSWIWCFDCYAYKDLLKTMGFIWCKKKKAWTWHSGEYRRHYKKEIPLNDIRAKYGSEKIKKQSQRYVIS